MPPKAKAAPKKEYKSQSDGMVLLCKENILEHSEDKTPGIIKLKHPHTDKAALFLFSANNSKVQEITAFSEDNRSWFVNENVRSDGRLFLSTPFNPVYLALPYLMNATTLSPLDQTLVDREFPETRRLLKCLNPKLLSLVADQKGDADMNVWKYNEEKTRAWLTRKVEQVVKVLEDRNIQVNEDGIAMSNTFVKTKSNDANVKNKDTYLRYAHGIVSEYLPSSLRSSLLSSLNLPEVKPADPSSKRKLLTAQSPNIEDAEAKRIKLDGDEFREKSTPAKKPKEPSAKDKALARSASGTKSISSFFKKMPA